MLANNAQIQWLPPHIKEGRFGNFLESNVDWALSRERFWGTPLPIWVCEKTGEMEAVSGYDELLSKPGVAGTQVWEAAKAKKPELPDDLKVHKPYIDAVAYDSPFAEGARMRRAPEVIDCWYDSGAMPFAQWGYPHRPGSHELVAKRLPADFISEALDQTRGWFYSLLAISTLIFDERAGTASAVIAPASGRGGGVPGAPQGAEGTAPSDPPRPMAGAIPYPHPYRACIVLGLMLGEDGQKMSKSKRNYREPNEIFDRYGADALRWYFFANQPPWTGIRYSEQAIKDAIPEFLLRLWNVYGFFVNYANTDGFDPAARLVGDVGQLDADVLAKADGYRPAPERRELDRWVLSELAATTRTVIAKMEAFDNYAACQALSEFVDALSNWYVRRSRDRFWSPNKTDPDKRDGYFTLYETLLTTCRLIAPFTPFIAEAMWRNLVGGFGERATESVHLCDYPTVNEAAIDPVLSQRMALGREIASLGRSARMSEKIRVRQPLAKVEVVLADRTHFDWLRSHAAIIAEELNVKQVELTTEGDEFIEYQVVPNFKRLGPRVGKLMPQVKKALGEADGAALLARLAADGKIALPAGGKTVELSGEDIEVRLHAKPGWAAAQGKKCVLVLSTEITPELAREGTARDLVRLIQDRRKEIGCEFTDRIEVGIVTEAAALNDAIAEHRDYIASETLAVLVGDAPLSGVEGVTVAVGGDELTLFVSVAKKDG